MFYINRILFFYFIILIGSISFADEEYYLTLRNDKDLCKKMSFNAKDMASQKFDRSILGSNFVNFIENV